MRHLTRLAALLLIPAHAATASGADCSTTPIATAWAADAAFPSGVAAVDVTATAATLWTRTATAGSVGVQVLDAQSCASASVPAATLTATTGDFTARFEVTGLRPGTDYLYRFVRDGRYSQAGRFRTAPVIDAPVRLAFAADFNYDPTQFALLDELRTTPYDALLILGDAPYADVSGTPVPQTLPEYQRAHAQLRRLASIQRLYGALPIVPIWDDHEVFDNWDGAFIAAQPARVQAALRAYRDYYPIRSVEAVAGYRKVSFGPNLDVFVLDSRSQRDANSARDTQTKTMLGPTQRNWLLDGLLASTAAFKIVVTSVPIGYTAAHGADSWQGFDNERRDIFRFIERNQIAGVVWLAGDQHYPTAISDPGGHRVFITGALAAPVKQPPHQTPQNVVWQTSAANWGEVTYSPNPATLRVRFIGGGQTVLYEASLRSTAPLTCSGLSTRLKCRPGQ